MVFNEEFIGSTEINISGKTVKVHLYRNENGNIERRIENEFELFPEGTCLDGYNDEIIIYEFKS